MEGKDALINTRGNGTQFRRSKDSSTQVTWKTIEAFNSILATCGSQDTPDIDTLDTLLESFHGLEKGAWTDFGFELGVVLVKVLSAIERTDTFEDLFLKLLSVLGLICEHDSDVWKSVARQILNVLINKKFSSAYSGKVFRVYVTVLRKVEGVALNSFARQNLNLLKSLSMMIRGLGDFETQVDFMELVFLHLSDKKLAKGFFYEAKGRVRDLLQSLRFADFEGDCRVYLNALNKEGTERKVLSIFCGILYMGGCFMEPPGERKGIWLDANKTSERLSLKCSDFSRERIFYIPFSNLEGVKLEKENNGTHSVTIKTKNLGRIYKEAKNNDVLCVAIENTREEVEEFVDFLQGKTQMWKKHKGKLSQTCDGIFIDRNRPGNSKVQDNVISSTKTSGGNLSLLKRNPENKTAWEVLTKLPESISPIEPNPSAFVDSFNLSLERHTFEDSITTVKFGKSHQLFPDFRDKENKPPKVSPERDWGRILRERKTLESPSQNYFRGSNPSRKKPSLPKLRKKCTSSRKKKPTELKKPTEQPQEKTKQPPPPRPSLLDPEGYAYQRWLKPTTSKRSNFWLNKLNEQQKPKQGSAHVFDFSEESDHEKGKQKNPKRTAKRGKKKNQTVMKEVKEILRKTPHQKTSVKEKTSFVRPKDEISKTNESKTKAGKKKTSCVRSRNQEKAKSIPELDLQVFSPVVQPTKEEDDEDELILTSDDEEAKKRERSEEENSLTRVIVKKKPKTFNPPPALVARLQQVEEKARQQTQEIIEAARKATNHVVDHVRRKEAQKMVAYLKTAEDAGVKLRELNDLDIRAKRVQRVVAYFVAGCSAQEFCDSVDGQLSKIRDAMSDLNKTPSDSSVKVKRIHDRLKDLIGLEIDRSIQSELKSRQRRLIQYFSSGFGGFVP